MLGSRVPRAWRRGNAPIHATDRCNCLGSGLRNALCLCNRPCNASGRCNCCFQASVTLLDRYNCCCRATVTLLACCCWGLQCCCRAPVMLLACCRALQCCWAFASLLRDSPLPLPQSVPTVSAHSQCRQSVPTVPVACPAGPGFMKLQRSDPRHRSPQLPSILPLQRPWPL